MRTATEPVWCVAWLDSPLGSINVAMLTDGLVTRRVRVAPLFPLDVEAIQRRGFDGQIGLVDVPCCVGALVVLR